jgi:uncharacterized membrane protein YeaQ/YmgE (transglycosylase-associated protein family)
MLRSGTRGASRPAAQTVTASSRYRGTVVALAVTKPFGAAYAERSHYRRSTCRCSSLRSSSNRADEQVSVSIIGWIVIGALAGWIASMITGRNEEMNWLENIVVGVVGALVGGFLYGVLTDADYTSSFSIGTLLVAIIGATILLFVYKALRRAR